jgi:hypothetical protein
MHAWWSTTSRPKFPGIAAEIDPRPSEPIIGGRTAYRRAKTTNRRKGQVHHVSEMRHLLRKQGISLKTKAL